VATSTGSAPLTPADRRRALTLPTTYRLVIGGDETTPATTWAALDPSTGAEWARVGQASAEHVDAAVGAARIAFGRWRSTSPAERQQLLRRSGDRVAEAGEWPALLAIENGRPIREAITVDGPVTTDIFRS
jgi:aldehyde dehydrogenase